MAHGECFGGLCIYPSRSGQPEQPYAEQARRVEQETHGRMRIDPVTGDVSIGTPTEQEQEPVAWLELRILSSGGYASPIKEWHVTQNPSTSNALRKPLYTHPPRREWRSLSEEEVDELQSGMQASHKDVRAIEAALRSKNT